MSTRPTVLGLTVDASGARELDDAIWIERLEGGGFSMTASAADVARHVPKGSPDDVTASTRSLNVYGEGPRESMLGSHVTSRLASLDARVPRVAVTVRVVYDASGAEVSRMAFRSSLRSLVALTYSSFDDILRSDTARLRTMCEAAVDLSRLLWVRRVALVGLPDWQAAFDASGALMPDLAPGVIGQTVVHEMMVAANAAATRLVKAAGYPMIYRNQGPRPGGPGGRYEVVCHGHSSLAESAYGQFFSPMRRFPDLVNQRALCAVSEGAPAPYSIAELSRVCADANLATQRADAISRAKEARLAEAAADGPGMDKLDPFAFRRIIRRRGGFDRRTLPEMKRRMEQGMLTHADGAWLLFGRDSPLDDGMRAEILRRLAASPGEIERIWRIGRDDHELPPFDFEMAHHDGLWSAAAAAGSRVAQADGGDPVRTRDLALVRLSAAAVGLPPPDEALPGDTGIRFADTKARMRLEALCHLMGWDQPEFTVEELPLNDPRRSSRGQATIETDTWNYRTPLAYGSNRAAVEMMTSELALAALQPYADDVLRADTKRYGVDFDALGRDEAELGAVSALDEFCRRYGARQSWIWLRERPSTKRYHCTLEVAAGGSLMRSVGWGSSRDAARLVAAEASVANLLGRGARRDAREEPDLSDAGEPQMAPVV